MALSKGCPHLVVTFLVWNGQRDVTKSYFFDHATKWQSGGIHFCLEPQRMQIKYEKYSIYSSERTRSKTVSPATDNGQKHVNKIPKLHVWRPYTWLYPHVPNLSQELLGSWVRRTLDSNANVRPMKRQYATMTKCNSDKTQQWQNTKTTKRKSDKTQKRQNTTATKCNSEKCTV